MLFKYYPSERVDVLENLKIRFSPLKSLNDPFECLPLIDIVELMDPRLELQRSELEEIWENTDEKTTENRELLEKTWLEHIDNYKKKTDPCNVGKELINDINDKFGILSLSRTEENSLMWSHYAEEGKGIVIGFDEDHSFFKQPDMIGKPTRPTPITYTNKRRKISPNEDKFREKILCEKPIEWAYEEEERVFRTFLSNKGSKGKDSNGMDIILTDLPKEAITSVYLGYRVSEATKNRTLSAIKNHSIPCKIYQGRVSTTEYKIKFKEVSI